MRKSIFILGVLLASTIDAGELKPTEGTHQWKSFVLHVREGPVEGVVVGGKCIGKDKDGHKRTSGCARWKASLPAAWLDGECWITVQDGSSDSLRRVLENWGHELRHCVKGSWHE